MPTLDWFGKKAANCHHRNTVCHLLRYNQHLASVDAVVGHVSDRRMPLQGHLWIFTGKVKCMLIDLCFKISPKRLGSNYIMNTLKIRQTSTGGMA